MCGIVGFSGPVKPGQLVSALSTIQHRGPDAQGRFEGQNMSIGHCRLSIIDLRTGQQPMYCDNGRFVIAYNGEIYNFSDLGETLTARGEKLTTSSDTEVLLKWLARYWKDGLPDLNGMFAFALWDRKHKRLLLARDRLGIKPLYVYRCDGDIAFSSEIKALLKIIDRREPDFQTIFQFLTFQNILSERTFFKDIFKLAPGSWLEWSPRGVHHGRFWDINFEQQFQGNFDKAVQAYKECFNRSIKRHMIADVPVGTYLSGGIDSSSVTVAASRLSPMRMHTFTGAFIESSKYDERTGAHAVASKINAHSHDIIIRDTDFAENIGRVVYHLDEPTLGTGALPQFMVAKHAAQNVKVVLTGHGGDETYAGYQVCKAVQIRESLQKNPHKLLSLLLSVRPDELSRVLYYLLYPLIFPEVGHGLYIMTPRRLRKRILAGDFISEVSPYEPLQEPQRFIHSGMKQEDILMTLYLKTYLPTLFIQEDKVGMAHSLEARIPLCDNEIIDLSLSINLDDKLKGNTLKAIPKAAMENELPSFLFGLPKRGFPTPFARWFRKGRVKELIQELLLSKRTRERSIFQTGYLSKLFNKNLDSRTDNLYDYARANQLYSYAIVELWFRTFIDNQNPSPIL